MLNTISVGTALPDHRINLNKSFFVMFLRNLDMASDHVNGARHVLENMFTNLFYFPLATSTQEGHCLCHSNTECGPGDDDVFVSAFKRVYFPSRICLGITVNNS